MGYDYDLICLGCGPAGEKAATQASYYGYRVAIVERDARPGGAMVNTGTIPSKALRETALLCSAFQRRPLPGMQFHIDHTISVPKFMARRYLIEHQEHDRIETSFDRHGIEVHRGQGRVVDEHTIAVRAQDGSEKRLSGRFILITTGSSPVRPDDIPFEHPNVVDADEVLQLDHMPESMIIVGGGVIGMEYASVFSEIDVDVTLVHGSRDVLPFLDPECRAHLTRSFADRDITILTERKVNNVVVPSDRRVEVTLDNGERYEAEVLLWAAGRQSNTAGLGLEKIGVQIDERGRLLTDENFRTDVPSIYAAGDVLGFPALAATSMEQGRVAACQMFDLDFKRKVSDITPIGIYTIPPISMVGMSATDAEQAGHCIVVGRASYRTNVRGRMLGDEEGLLKCIFDRDTRTLLGASIVGEEATELIHIAQCAIAHKAGIDYFINACFNYPTLSELYKYAAYSALQNLKEQDHSDGAPLKVEGPVTERAA